MVLSLQYLLHLSIGVLQCGLQIGAAYSSLGLTKVLYATFLVLVGAKAKFLKTQVLVALDEISEIRFPRFPDAVCISEG